MKLIKNILKIDSILCVCKKLMADLNGDLLYYSILIYDAIKGVHVGLKGWRKGGYIID